MKYLAANSLARLNILGPSQCMQAFLLFSGSAMFSDSTCQEYKYVSQVCFLYCSKNVLYIVPYCTYKNNINYEVIV